MSACSRTPLTSRRKIVVAAASMTSIAASAPLLLRHSGSSDWTDTALGLLIGLAFGVTIGVLVMAIIRFRKAS